MLEFGVRFPVSAVWKKQMFLPQSRVKLSIVGSLRDREVACSSSDRQGSNFESCVWRAVSSHSSHHPQEVLLAQFSLYVHKGGLKPDSFHFFIYLNFHPIEVVCRYRDLQLQGAENYSYLFNFRLNINKYWYLNSHLITNNNDSIGK